MTDGNIYGVVLRGRDAYFSCGIPTIEKDEKENHFYGKNFWICLKFRGLTLNNVRHEHKNKNAKNNMD